MPTAWKVLNANGSACHGGRGTWPLPNGHPGAWYTVTGPLIACENGLHLCRREQLVHWLGPAIFEVEYDPDGQLDAPDKLVVARARLLHRVRTWTEQTARLFACDCAEMALPVWEQLAPRDRRPRTAIEVARRYATQHDVPLEDLTAAWAAAWAAAETAAGAGAWSAAGAAAWAAAETVAWAAAATAAETAAGAAAATAVETATATAAWAAAATAARARQTDILFGYLYPAGACDEATR